MDAVLVSNLNVNGLNAGAREPILDELTPPLGLLTLASVATRANFATSIVDLNYLIAANKLSLDNSFYEGALEILAKLETPLFGFSTMCNSMHITLRLAQQLKSMRPDASILLGGPQVSFVDIDVISTFPFVDFVLRGEAEYSFPQLLHCLDGTANPEEVLGLTYRSVSGATKQNPPAPIVEDLDTIPVPAWDIFPYDISNVSSIDVGRGCPFACGFCSTSVFFQRRFRLKSFERILQEMYLLRDNYGASSINLVHDLFTANKKWVRAFCERLLDESNFNIKWSASARIDTVDGDLLSLMGKAGCRGLFYGVESGSPRIQKAMGKRLKVENVPAIANAAAAAGVRCTMSFIAGFPMEEINDLRQTFDMIQQLLLKPKLDLQLHIMSPQTGTADYKTYHDRLMLDTYFSDITNSPHVFLEADWIRDYPEIFPSFYHYRLTEISRETLVRCDQFIRLPCTVLRRTVHRILRMGTSLWDMYIAWNHYISSRSNVEINEVAPDEVLISFIEFAEKFCGERDWMFPHELGRDELLAFYLYRYHGVRAAWMVESGSTTGDTEFEVEPASI